MAVVLLYYTLNPFFRFKFLLFFVVKKIYIKNAHKHPLCIKGSCCLTGSKPIYYNVYVYMYVNKGISYYTIHITQFFLEIIPLAHNIYLNLCVQLDCPIIINFLSGTTTRKEIALHSLRNREIYCLLG